MRFSILLALFFLLLGASILLNVMFKIHFPFARIALALFLIYAGVSLILGVHARGWRDEGTNYLGAAEFRPRDLTNREFNVIMGKGVLDLSELRAPGATLKLNVVFGEAIVRYNPSVPLQVQSSGAFSDMRLPDGSRTTFGELRYRSKNASDAEPGITLEVSTVFGATRFEEATLQGVPLSQRATSP